MSSARRAEARALGAVAEGLSDDPFAVLGRHPAPAGSPPAAIIRTLQPAASAVEVVAAGRVIPMERRRPEGLFVAAVPWDRALEELGYVLRVHEGSGVRDLVDPYQFGPLLTDFDLHLFSEGRHLRAWELLGSRRRTVGAVEGVHFAVWAPNAQRVSVVGDFNRWDGRVHVMRRLVPSGVWEIFIPGLADGDRYKYEVRTRDGHLLDKADPSKVIARSREPLVRPERTEREGYVPNVVYTCGALSHRDTIVLPYAVSDTFSNFATIKISALLANLAS